MTNRIGRWGRLAATLGIAVVALGSGLAQAQERLRWKLAGAYPSSLAVIGQSQIRFTQWVEQLTDGNFRIQFNEPGALVPGGGIFDAVQAGSIEMGYGGLGLWIGKDSSLSVFNALPFGPNASEYLAWKKFGGGQQLQDEILAQFKIKTIDCSLLEPEASGWFRKEIKTVDDLKGLKMRIAGLGGRTIEKLGVSSQLITPGDIYPALERGVIDAAEFSMPVMDQTMGLWQVAKHYYFPGWHQPFTFNQLLVNLDKWNALPPKYKLAVEMACERELLTQLAEGAASNAKALNDMAAKGITVHTWPEPIMEAFRKAWDEVAAEESAKNPNFKKAYDSLQAFRQQYAQWHAVGFLK